jgi:hypothetical protein
MKKRKKSLVIVQLSCNKIQWQDYLPEEAFSCNMLPFSDNGSVNRQMRSHFSPREHLHEFWRNFGLLVNEL